MNQVVLTGFADEISNDADEQIATLQKTGVSHLELRGVGGANVLDLSPAAVAVFKQQLDGAGIGVSAIGSPIGKVQVRSDLAAHFDRFRIAVHADAKRLGNTFRGDGVVGRANTASGDDVAECPAAGIDRRNDSLADIWYDAHLT